MELPARQVYSPASSVDTFRRYRTSTSELLMSAVWDGRHTQSPSKGHTVDRKGAGAHLPTPCERTVRLRGLWGLHL